MRFGGNSVDNRSIGVFDSGIGGLTMVREMIKIMPDEHVIYFGDTGRVPYGTKSDQTVRKYVESDIKFLMQFDLKMIIAACGTASAIALPHIKDNYEIPVFGVVEAAASAAILATKNKKIGIIGTQSTIKSDCYSKLIEKRAPDIFTMSAACPLFVPLVENGYCDKEAAYLIAEDYLLPLKEAGVDTLIMGCTHYPHLENTIKKVMGEGVTLINPSLETAVYIKKYLIENNLEGEKRDDEKYRFFASDDTKTFAKLGSKFLERKIDGNVTKIDIEKYT